MMQRLNEEIYNEGIYLKNLVERETQTFLAIAAYKRSSLMQNFLKNLRAVSVSSEELNSLFRKEGSSKSFKTILTELLREVSNAITQLRQVGHLHKDKIIQAIAKSLTKIQHNTTTLTRLVG